MTSHPRFVTLLGGPEIAVWLLTVEQQKLSS
jgi:hypothetical protein